MENVEKTLNVEEKKAKLKKITKHSKKGVILSLAAVVLCGLSNVVIGGILKCNYDSIAKENGYDKKNLEYRSEQVVDYADQYKNGKITAEELEDKIAEVEDLDQDEFMKIDPNVSKEDYERYSDYRRTDDIVRVAGLTFATGTGVAALVSQATYAVAEFKHEDIIREEESQKRDR